MASAGKRRVIERLRTRLAGPRPGAAASMVSGARPWAALEAGALCDIAGADWRDGPAAESYAAALAARHAKASGGVIVWIALRAEMRDAGRLYAPFTDDLAARLTLCLAADMKSLLWSAEEAARTLPRAAIIVDARKPHKLLSLTATRRLQLAAETSRAALVLLRAPVDAAPSCAQRRLRVRAWPSAEEPYDASAPGRARWRVELERCRAGGRGAWVVEWDHATGELCEAPPLHEPRFAALADGSLAAVGAVA